VHFGSLMYTIYRSSFMHFNKSNITPQIFVTKIGIKQYFVIFFLKNRCGHMIFFLFLKKDVAMLGRLRFMRNNTIF